MNLHLTTLHFKPWLTMAALVLSMHCVADESAALSSVQPGSESSTPSPVSDAPTTAAMALPKGLAGSMLLDPTVQFKNAAGTPGYYKEAYEHHCHAARSGDAKSQFALAWLYERGRGVAKDENMAAFLYGKAADQGYARAQEVLAGIPAGTSQPDLPACLLPDPPPAISTASADTPPDTQVEATAFYPKDGPIFDLVNKLAPRYQIDANLAMAFIAVESGFDAKATSPKNAQGLMQLIPDTAKRFRVKNAYNAEDNIKGGLAYLQWLLAFFQGDVELVAAAYNSGEKTVERYKGVPPYPETRNYVQKIAALYRKSTHPFRDDVVKASSMLRLP